jgi:hypothetical protein
MNLPQFFYTGMVNQLPLPPEIKKECEMVRAEAEEKYREFKLRSTKEDASNFDKMTYKIIEDYRFKTLLIALYLPFQRWISSWGKPKEDDQALEAILKTLKDD